MKKLYTCLAELTSEYEFAVQAESRKEAVKIAKLIYGKNAVKSKNVWELNPEMSDEAAEYKKIIGRKK